MVPAVSVADSLGTVFARPTLLASAPLDLQVKDSVGRAVWQALPGRLVDLPAAVAVPALAADARAVHTEAVARTVGIGAVD